MPFRRLAPLAYLLFASLAGCATSWAGRGDIPYSDLENEREAHDLNRGIRENPEDARAKYRLVQIYMDELMFDRAERELREITRQAPQDLQAYELLALLQAKGPENDVPGAIATLRAALRLAPKESTLHSDLALRYLDRGDVDAAAIEAKAAADLADDPRARATAYLILSGISALRGRSEEASRYAAQAEEIEPGSTTPGVAPVRFPLSAGVPSSLDELFASHPSSMKRARRLDELLRKRRESEPQRE